MAQDRGIGVRDHNPYQPAHQLPRSQAHPHATVSTGDILVWTGDIRHGPTGVYLEGQRDVRMSLAVGFSTIEVTVPFGLVPSQFRGRTNWRLLSALPSLLPFHQPHERTCGLMVI
ncbi:hypothetical protein TNCV_2762401 [Trichonephila clavipes]|nr:hypothetical protein TNCV_2762401 [Trichonephila clavipes]